MKTLSILLLSALTLTAQAADYSLVLATNATSVTIRHTAPSNEVHTGTAVIQFASTNRWPTNAAPVVPTEEGWVQSFTPGTVRNDFSGWLGKAFTNTEYRVITHLGRYSQGGDAGTNITVVLYEASPLTDRATATITNDGTLGWKWTALSTPYEMSTLGVAWYLLSNEINAGPQWLDSDTAATFDATSGLIPGPSVWSDAPYGIGVSIDQTNTASVYVPLSMKWE